MDDLKIDGWSVSIAQGSIARGGETHHLEPQVMDLLVFLAKRAGEVCSREDILDEAWRDSFVGDAALHSAVYALRKAFGDDARKPRVLETIPRRGYRLIGEVSRPRAIAVLPFDNLARDSEEDYFADGMTEALISELGRCQQLSVTSRQTIMAYRDRQSPLPEVAGELGVELVVAGSVLRVGDRARLTVQLIDAEQDRHIWSESYERELGDIIALQRELARSIVGEVLRKSSPALAVPRAERDPDALIHFLRGRYHWYRFTPESFERALDHFEAAVRIEPDFGDALAGLADLWGAQAYWGLLPTHEVLSKVDEATARAVSRDPSSADALAIRAFNHLYFHRDFSSAEDDLRRALAINRSSLTAHLGLAICLISAGRVEEADPLINRGIQLDPLNPAMIAVRAMRLMARPGSSEAEGALAEALAVEPSHRLSNQLLADLLWAEKPERALAHERLWWQPDPEIAALFEPEAGQGDHRAALETAAEVLVERSRRAHVQPTAIARLFGHAGRDDIAIDWLERAERESDPRLVDSFRLTGPWDRLRGDERFDAIGAALRLPDYA